MKEELIMHKQEIYQFAHKTVLEAGKLLLELKKQPLVFSEKTDYADLVTEVDKKVEAFLVNKITERYPTHGILGEEGTFKEDLKNFETIWVIDPIDGTTNFIQDFPFYAISVGIIHQGEGVMGFVYNPSTDELFHAVKGQGAFVNQEKLELDKPLALKETVFSTSMFWEDVTTQNALHPSIIELYKNTRGMRMLGGAALSLCEIAKGTLNAYIMPMLSPWDYAGGVIVLQEAGGTITGLHGESVQYKNAQSILATHPAIHTEILQKFQSKANL